jgi:hypothetical protein
MRSKTEDPTNQMGIQGVWRLKSYYLVMNVLSWVRENAIALKVLA